MLSELDAADQAVTHLQATPRGLLRVNAPMSFGTLQLGPAIADFMERYPELRIQLVLSDAQVPRWTLCVNNAEVSRDAAINARGIAVLLVFIASDALNVGGCKRVSPTTRPPQLALYAVYPPTQHLAVKVRLFIDFLVERFGSRSNVSKT